MMTLDQIIADQFTRCERAMMGLSPDVPVILTICGYGDDGISTIIPAQCDGADERTTVADMAGEIMRNQRCVAYSVVSEMWFVSLRFTDADYKNLDNITPSEHKERQEGVVIYAEDIDGNKKCRIWNIARKKNGMFIALIFNPKISSGMTESLRFGGLLRNPGRKN